MRRGEIWTVSAGSGLGAKPRPCVIIQDDAFAATDSVTIAPCTSETVPADFRVELEPSDGNGLRVATRLMVDKVITVQRSKLGERLGALTGEEMGELNRALLVFLGLTVIGGS